MAEPKTQFTRREILRALLAGGAAAACASTAPFAAVQLEKAQQLILCGGAEVFIVEFAAPVELPKARKVWSWRAADCPDIPATLKRAFRTTDDCKPVEGGRRILVSSSSGAVALIERASGRALFHAPVVNAHSVEMLPGGRIAAAASVGAAPGANRVIIFDAATGRELVSDRLVSAHGLVWDEARRLLWALGMSELRAYRMEEGRGGAPALKVDFSIKLPDASGHDLTPIPGSPRLFVSTNTRCWFFDRDARRFSPHDALATAGGVKSCSVHPSTGRIAYTKNEGQNWWSENVHFLNPKGEMRLTGERLYKARWLAGEGGAPLIGE